jgi:hypothetical protein
MSEFDPDDYEERLNHLDQHFTHGPHLTHARSRAQR